MTTTPKPKSYILRDIPADLWAQAKSVAASQDETMHTVLIRALESYVGIQSASDPDNASVVSTHHVTWDAPDLHADVARAVCGAWVNPAKRSVHPTCSDCQAWLDQYDSLDIGGNPDD